MYQPTFGVDVVHTLEEHPYDSLEDGHRKLVSRPILLEEPQRFPHWFKYKAEMSASRPLDLKAVQ